MSIESSEASSPVLGAETYLYVLTASLAATSLGLVTKRLWLKALSGCTFSIMTTLYTAAVVFTTLAIAQRGRGADSGRNDLLALIVRCAAAWMLVAVGSINTSIMYFELVVARKDKRKVATDIISQIANGVLVSSFLLTCISVSSAVASCLIAYPTGIFVMSLFLDTYVPSACVCVVWAINQRTRLRRKYVAGFERPPNRRTSVKTCQVDDDGQVGRGQVDTDDPANWRSDFVRTHVKAKIPPMTEEKPASNGRPSLRRVSTGTTVWSHNWQVGSAAITKTIEETERIDETPESSSPLVHRRRSSGSIGIGSRYRRTSRIGPEARYSDIILDMSVLDELEQKIEENKTQWLKTGHNNQ
ncbi:hypothetical protein OIO90_003785 [Microbotryomycetes sp. JL221]|nr:hypothetical protein OIO90_003785 [Microbotryomycetes sp. JL221]